MLNSPLPYFIFIDCDEFLMQFEVQDFIKSIISLNFSIRLIQESGSILRSDFEQTRRE
jgi:hypothetical protein